MRTSGTCEIAKLARPPWTKRIKAVLGFTIYSLGLHRLLLRNRSLVVAFHRVSNSALASSINCTPEEFERYCVFLKKHFDVIPLHELVARMRNGKSIGGTAAITFDDGYHDNAHNAAPILLDLNLPATFFVTTQFVESATQAFWDVEAGVRSRWMSWSDVRELDSKGFDIGCHTENHVDLGTTELALASDEIERSIQKIKAQIGKAPRHFAYPFGGRNNIRPATLDLVKRAGFDCCVSCHGGLVRSGSDVFEMLREPISAWHETPYQFGFELLFAK